MQQITIKLTLTLIQPASKWMHWATVMPFWSVLSCHLWFLPGNSHPWRCSSTVHADDLDPFWTLGPVVVCAGDPFVSHVQADQANGVFFHWVCHPRPVLTLTSSFVTLSIYPRCSFVICDGQHSAFSIVLLLEVIPLHSTEGLIGLLLRTTSSSALG